MKKKGLKRFIALVLALVVFFGVSPKLDSKAAANTVKLGKTEKTAGIIKTLGATYYATMPEGDRSSRYLKFKTKNYRGFYKIKVTNISVDGGIGVGVTNDVGISCEKGESVFFDEQYGKNEWVYIDLNTAIEDLRGRIKIQIFPREDKEGYSMDHAMKLTVNKTKNARMDGHDDVDYFKFTAPVSAKYKVTWKNVNIPSRARLRLTGRYSDGREMFWSGYTYPSYQKKGETRSIECTLIKGKTYYFVADNSNTSIPGLDWHVGYRGDYTITIQKK